MLTFDNKQNSRTTQILGTLENDFNLQLILLDLGDDLLISAC